MAVLRAAHRQLAAEVPLDAFEAVLGEGREALSLVSCTSRTAEYVSSGFCLPALYSLTGQDEVSGSGLCWG